MIKVTYCTSEDQLKWIVPTYRQSQYVRMTNSELGDQRYDIFVWISEHCTKDVVLWNETSRPSIGDSAWGNRIYPNGDIRIYFEEPSDGTMFILKWINKDENATK